MKLALFLKSYPGQDKALWGKKDKAQTEGICVSQHFPKLSWLETLPARHGPWNLSRKNLSSRCERVSPIHVGEQIPFSEAPR